MQDISIAGAQFTDVPAIEIPKISGGIARFTDVSDTSANAADVKSGKKLYLADGSAAIGTYLYNWMGDDAEFVSKVYESQFALADTLFATWTPSTTAKAIQATQTASTFSASMTEYEYLIRWRVRFDAAYNEGATLKAQVFCECAELWQVLMRRPNSLANLAAENFAGNACLTYFSAPLNVYYSTAGTKTYTYSISYGIYPSVTAATFSSSTANAPTVTIKTPAINARCSSTYFATARASELDQSNSIVKIVGELYRMKTGAAARSMYGGLADLYANSI